MDFLESIFCLAGLVGQYIIHLLTATSLALHSVPKQNRSTFLCDLYAVLELSLKPAVFS